MARYRKRRYGFKKRLGKWAPNISEVNQEFTATPGNYNNQIQLALNPIQSDSVVSQIYTFKNFDLSFTVEASSHWYLEGITAYVMYVPQGMTLTSNYNTDHPEYILAYKYLGSPTGVGTSAQAEIQQFQPHRVKSRLSRKLNTGDRVLLLIKGFNENTTSINYTIRGVIRWWTKAN